MSGALKRKLLLKDVIVDCAPDDVGSPSLNGLTLVILDIQLDLEKSSETKWKYNGVVELPSLPNELVITARSDAGDIGHIIFMNNDWDKIRDNGPSESHLIKAFDTKDLNLSLSLYLQILQSASDQESELGSPTINPTVHYASYLRLSRGHDDPLKADQLKSLGDQFLQDFKTTRNEEDIFKAIQTYKQAAACLSVDNQRVISNLMDICNGYRERYNTFDRPEDLQEAIATGQMTISITPEGHALFPNLLNELGTLYSLRFERTGSLDDISEAIRNQQRSVEHTPRGHADLPDRLSNLGISLFHRFEYSGNLEDISQAIKFQQLAVDTTPVGNADLPGDLSNLGSSFARRFEHTGDLEDISEAIRNQKYAVELTSDGHADLRTWLHNLGVSFSSRFEYTGDLDDISEAIKNLQRAVELSPDGDADRPSHLNSLGNAFSSRFEHTGDMDDISEAIENQQCAVELTPNGHADLPGHLNNLGTSFSLRFEHTGDMDDISEAIEKQQRVVKLAPEGHSNLPGWLVNLGNSLARRFEHSGNLEDISEAINIQQSAVELTPEGHADLPGWLDSLGTSLTCRFEYGGDLGDITEAIKNQRRAVQLTPEGHADLPGHLSNLGLSFLNRFEDRGDLEDLSEAIENQHRAVELAQDGDASLRGWLINLGNSLACRFEHRESLDDHDISEAIKYQQRAIELTPDRHPDLPAHLNDLGASFSRRFGQSGDVDDISEAIKFQQRAVQLTPKGHADLPRYLSNLGNFLSSRFEHNGSLEDIADAIKNQQRAIDLTPDGYADLPARLGNLGVSFARRFERTGDPEYLEKALSNYCRAATSTTGSPSVRLNIAKKWVRALQSSSFSSQQLLDAHACTIHLLSLVSGLGNTIQHRHQTLANSSQLSVAASAAALLLDCPHKALEWLVEGRYIVWNQIIQLRTPLDELRAHDKLGACADRLSVVSRELERAGSRFESHSSRTTLLVDDKISSEEQAANHINLAKEWDQLLSTIRKTAGFEDFLRPRKCADIMRRLPDEGIIVIINIHNDRCDALALMAGTDKPMHIPLPEFSYQEAERLAKGLQGHLLHHGVVSRIGTPLDGPEDPEDPLPTVGLAEVLSVLWSQVVWPILESLSISISEPSQLCSKLPRIWWCPTGPLAFLPIHAAGSYVRREGVPKGHLSDFVVSSYIPTVNALLKTSDSDSVEKHGDGPSGLLTVSQPNTPGKPPLPYAAVEAKRIVTQLENGRISSVILSDEGGRVESVLKAMESFPSIHLACHALQNTTNPLKSSISLHDGPLELSEIMKKNFPYSDFAFLSACQTSTGDKNLPEEVVHLAAGMLAAGYRSVVGTMWSIPDKYGPEIAEFFYESLLDNATNEGGLKINGAEAARALHHAVGRFREKISDLPDSLLVWVPYIHIGV